MSSRFSRLSIAPWFELEDETTWEWKNIEVSDEVYSVKSKVDSYVAPRFSWQEMHSTRKITGEYIEKFVSQLLWAKLASKNQAGYDMILPDGSQLESKAWRLPRKGPVIIRHQLDLLDDEWFYALTYYSTTKNVLPAELYSKKWRRHLVRNMHIRYIYIFPKRSIVYFYNDRKWIRELQVTDSRNWKTIKNKSISRQRAEELFQENKWKHTKNHQSVKHWRHSIEVFTLWYEL